MPRASIKVFTGEKVGRINPNIYGHFMEHLGNCIYGGCWVGEDSTIPNTHGIRNDVVAILKRVSPPVVRWPGGCFADDYHWRDGIGPRNERPRRINIHWGDVIEDNQFGTHEFHAFCKEIGAQPYFCGNLGSGSPREMRNWVEYCNYPGDSSLANERAANGNLEPMKIRYWGVGNENWGCGGNFTPEDYGTEYRRFATYLRNWGDAQLFLIACGPNGNDEEWTRRFFEKLRRNYWCGPALNGFAAHYYCGTAGTATQYTEAQWYELLWKAVQMEPLVVVQRSLLDEYDPERHVGLIVDEWGTWHPAAQGRNPSFLWQQNTVRDALVAALSLDIFNRHADKVVMANIAQTINVLQSLVLTDGDKAIATPTCHVYELYKPHQNGVSVLIEVETPEIDCQVQGGDKRLKSISASASIKDGRLTLTVVNAEASEPVEVNVSVLGFGGKAPEIVGLAYPAGDIRAHNTFDSPDVVSLGATAAEWREGVLILPPASVTRATF